MPFRLRWTDAFALVGIVLLVTWTPAYLAADPEAKAVEEGSSFIVPNPRIGDHVVYDLFVTGPSGATETIKRVLEVEWRAPEPNEAPYDAVYVEEWTRTAVDVRLDWGRVDEAGRVVRVFVDQEGAPVWVESEGWRASVGDEQNRTDAVWEVAGQRPGTWWEWRSARVGEEVAYEPSQGRAFMREITAGMWAEMFREDHSAHLVLADHVLDHNGLQLLGSLHDADRIFDDAFGDHRVRHEEETYFGIGFSHLRLDVRSDAPIMADEWPDNSEWYHDSFAVPLGLRNEWRRPDGTPVVRMHLLPNEVREGTGVPLSYAHGRGPSPMEPFTADPIPDPTTPTVKLSTLGSDDRPLMRDISLADLVAFAAAPSAPASVRSFVQGGGNLVGFTWYEIGLESTTGADTSVLPVPPLSLTKSRADPLGPSNHHTRWVLLFAKPDGAVRVAELRVREQVPDGTIEATVTDACADGLAPLDPAWPLEVACNTVAPRLVAPTRPVPDPQALIQSIEDNHPVPRDEHDCDPATAVRESAFPCEFSFDATFTLERTGMLAASTAPITQGADRYLHPIGSIRPESGIAGWRTANHVDANAGPPRGPTHGVINLADGRFLSMHESRDADGSQSRPAATTVASVGSLPVPVPGASTAAAAGGVALVALSLLLRMWSAVAAGAHLPLLATLFSRIDKEDTLRHERRNEIVELLRADPGLTLTSVSSRLRYSRNATLHHVETLRRNGLLVHVQRGRSRHYFVADNVGRSERLRAAYAHDEAYAAFLSAVEAEPGATLSDLLDRLPQTKWNASRTGTRLASLGLVRKEKDGRSVRFYPPDA